MQMKFTINKNDILNILFKDSVVNWTKKQPWQKAVGCKRG